MYHEPQREKMKEKCCGFIACLCSRFQRPPGIMSTLDDVCSTMHAVSEGSEKTLMEVSEITRK